MNVFYCDQQDYVKKNGYVNASPQLYTFVRAKAVVSIEKQCYQPVRDEQDLVSESNSQREGQPYALKAEGVKSSPAHSLDTPASLH